MQPDKKDQVEINRERANAELQKELDRILKIDPERLTPEDVAFLAARRSYVKKSQLIEYQAVIDENDAKEEARVKAEQEALHPKVEVEKTVKTKKK